MTVDEIHLKPSHQANLEVGSLGVIHVDARDGYPLTVRLGVAADEEHRYNLRPGDSFEVRDQTWKLDRVENSATPDWTVVLIRVE